MHSLKTKKILIGITGGIAAYKVVELIRELRRCEAEVRVVMTSAAQAFVTPLTLQAISGYPVLLDWNSQESQFAMDHIALARWADLILIAPATAHCLAQLAHGLASDALTTLCLAATVPLFVAPAMNQQMWQHQATQANLKLLQARGVYLIGPNSGEQACGEIGFGRMSEPLEMLQQIQLFFNPNLSLNHLTLLITAGPTREPLDPVRYLSNHSSGKMGYAIAEAAAQMGAKVLLVSGPTQLACPKGVERLDVVTAQEMSEMVHKHIDNVDIFIATAAVADYAPASQCSQKIKKTAENFTLQLIRNPDILANVAALVNRPFVVGFAAETESLLQNAKQKLIDKKLDLIAANWVNESEGGFNSEQNELWVLSAEQQFHLPMQSKQQVAVALLELILNCFNKQQIPNLVTEALST